MPPVPALQRLSDISGPWILWEVLRDCEEESPNNEFGVREPVPPPPSYTFFPGSLWLLSTTMQDDNSPSRTAWKGA